MRRIHNGGYVPIDSEDNTEARNGDDVVTTFDIKLQDIVESALNHTLTENKAEQGCAILMDVETGYVKALANLRLNHETGVYEESYNVALTERYEPGSVFKIISMVVLLNQKRDTKLTDLVNIGTGPIKFSNRVMKDDHSFAKQRALCTWAKQKNRHWHHRRVATGHQRPERQGQTRRVVEGDPALDVDRL